MAPRTNPWSACRSLAFRFRPSLQAQQPSIAAVAFARRFSSQPTAPSDNDSSTSPMLPSWMISPPKPPGKSPDDSQSPSEAGSDPTRLSPNQEAIMKLDLTSQGINAFEETGLKFEEPPMPTAKLHEAQYHMRFRYEEGIEQLTRLLMRHGKLSKAQNDMAMVLNYLRTSPPPKINPAKPLLPGSPPAEHLPLNPNLYLMIAIDSVAPLIQIRGFTGLAGGGKALEVPVPISRRARRRIAFMWIMDVVNKKQSAGSGKKMLAHRIGDEIVAVAQGTSGVWDKRQQLHKQGMTVRANLNAPQLRTRKIL